MTRFYRAYRRFPGVSAYLTLLRSGKAKGTWLDLVCWELSAHAAENVESIVTAFHNEPDEWVRMLLLSWVAETGLPEFLPLLQENLSSEQERLRYWAELGLEKIDTKEARTILWHYKSQV